MNRFSLVAGALLCVTPVVADEVFDAAYVSNPAACERADEADFGMVLLEEQAWAVYPSKGILGGEMMCYFHNQQMLTNGDWAPELFATARCLGYDTNFVDQVAVAPDSFSINQTHGDDGIDHKLGEMVEVISLRADANPPEYENYKGEYTRCDAASEKVLEWFK